MANTLNVCFFIATTLLVQTLIHPFVSGAEFVDPETGYIYVPASAPHDYEAYAPDLFIDNEPPVSPGAKKATPEFIALVKACVGKMDIYCGEEIFSHILGDTTHVTKPCCEKLLKMGMKCHVTLASIALSADEFKDRKAEGIPKSKKIWNTCVSDVGATIGAPASLEV